MFKYFVTIFVSVIVLAFAHSALAAQIYILPAEKSFEVGKEISVDIKINSETESINAAQATLHWPADILEFIEIDKTDSSFDFWVEEPKVSADGNSLVFIGGTAKGISGDALQILKIKFKTRIQGTAEISISDAATTANDGRGTNVLSKIKGAIFYIGTEIVPEIIPVSTPEKPQPVEVERKAIPASKLPQKPVVQITLYPDETKWYNHLDEVLVFWEVPNDVVSVATVLDHNSNTVPLKKEKELTTGKNFGVLQDGIWYVHTRFSNNLGWGPVTHYRLAIDTKSPLAFELSVPEGETTDNPAPILQFKTSDSLSGIGSYKIKIDDSETINIPVTDFLGNFTVPLQVPGKHRVTVKAVDQAGNSIEDSVLLDILPIPSAVITFTSRELFSEETTGLIVKGTALPNIDILLQVYQLLGQEKGEVTAQETVQSDDRGNWQSVFSEPFRNGKYIVTAQSRDVRGALGLTTESSIITVKAKPIIQIGAFQLSMSGAILFLFLVLVGGFGSGVWYYKKRQGKLTLRVEFAESEITKIFELIKSDVGRIAESLKAPTNSDSEYTLKKLQENIQKMEIYLKRGVEKINK